MKSFDRRSIRYLTAAKKGKNLSDWTDYDYTVQTDTSQCFISCNLTKMSSSQEGKRTRARRRKADKNTSLDGHKHRQDKRPKSWLPGMGLQGPHGPVFCSLLVFRTCTGVCTLDLPVRDPAFGGAKSILVREKNAHSVGQMSTPLE